MDRQEMLRLYESYIGLYEKSESCDEYEDVEKEEKEEKGEKEEKNPNLMVKRIKPKTKRK